MLPLAGTKWIFGKLVLPKKFSYPAILKKILFFPVVGIPTTIARLTSNMSLTMKWLPFGTSPQGKRCKCFFNKLIKNVFNIKSLGRSTTLLLIQLPADLSVNVVPTFAVTLCLQVIGKVKRLLQDLVKRHFGPT